MFGMSSYIFSFRQTWNCSLATEHPVYKVTDVNTLKSIAILNLYPPLHSKYKFTCSFQGGGSGKSTKTQPKTVTFFPCEIVAVLQPAPVCDINKVSMIPCAEQCHMVLSQLYKVKENNGTKFCYAQFPLA